MGRSPSASACFSHWTDSFEERLSREHVQLRRSSIQTVQINLGRLCNQACLHCHLKGGPQRKEIMSPSVAEQAVDFVLASGAIYVDLTGGAPELNPSFRDLVSKFRKAGLHVIDRSNLTVFFEPGMGDLPEFLAKGQVEINASLPCYTQENVDNQRGKGVFQRSIQALRLLNALGYGCAGTGLTLNLVYNPIGANLPGHQESLEAEYRRELTERFDIHFNHLFVLTNMPIGRFASSLRKSGDKDRYSGRLAAKFNSDVLSNLMCLRQVSLSWDGFFYDCDFNQAMDLPLGNSKPYRLGSQPPTQIASRLIGLDIRTGMHCYGCTAGSGSSCQGSLQ